MTVSQTVLVFDETILRGIFSRMSLSLDWSNVLGIGMISLRLWVWRRKTAEVKGHSHHTISGVHTTNMTNAVEK